MQEKQIIDFRSDVLSRAPQGMLKVMNEAKVGDDVRGDDPTTNLFEETVAKKFNKQAAIFFPSTTMGSLAVTITWCKPGEEIIIWGKSHAIQRQCSNLTMLGGVLTRQLFSENGLFDPVQIDKSIRKKEHKIAYPDTTLVFAENPTFTGIVYPLQQWKHLKQVCTKNKVHLHVDGARIYHAISKYKCKPADLSQYYESMSICLTKSLSCPAGAVVLGDRDFINKLRFTRKALGGTMRQTGLMTAAGLWAIENMPDKIDKDNQITIEFAKKLLQFPQLKVNLATVQTNMINFGIVDPKFPHENYKKYLFDNGIRIKSFNQEEQLYRLVIYPQIREKQIQKYAELTQKFLKKIKKRNNENQKI